MNRGVFFVIFLVVVIVVAVFVGEHLAPPERNPYSSRNREEEGSLAFYRLLEKYTVVERVDTPLDHLESGTLLMIGPVRPPSLSEQEYLVEWVEKGNKLVVFSDNLQVIQQFGVVLSSSKRTCATLTPLKDHWSTAHVEAIQFSYSRYFSSYKGDALFTDGKKAVVIEMKKGEGVIFLISDTSIVWNSTIDKEDNEIFLVHLALSDKVYFDEYHLYQLKVEKGFTWESVKTLVSSKYLPFFVQLIVVLALFIAVYGKRFGAARPVVPREVQSSELVVSAADLYYKAGKKEALKVIDTVQ